MRMLLRPEFPNGHFGDPALYIWEINEKDALLIDCGDLSRFTTRQLLKTKYIFLSHCHIDHFFGFDLFLRVHVGSEKNTFIYGPPQTSERVAGKLQGYTWNLVYDQTLEFTVIDLDSRQKTMTTTHFHARDGFRSSRQTVAEWNPLKPVLDAGIFHVHTVELDHRTPSLAYSVEEKETVSVNSEVMKELGLRPGPWVADLKHWYLFDRAKSKQMDVPTVSGTHLSFDCKILSKKILIPRQRHKIVYATDGAANDENRRKLLTLAEGADEFYSETCFLKEDQHLADETKHFTAQFMAEVATQAKVKKIIPFHFSKRYLARPKGPLEEVAAHFKGEIGDLSQTKL